MGLRHRIAETLRHLAGKLDHGPAEPAPPAASRTVESAPAPWPSDVDLELIGLRDAVADGWFNNQTGELFTGFPVGAGDVLADIGCGPGGNAAFCARQGAQVILVDVDAQALAAARQRLDAAGAAAELHLSDGGALPIADQRCTHVVCTEVLEHVADPAAFMAELVRIGQPGAHYLITVPATLSEQAVKQVAAPACFEPPNHIRIFEQDQFHQLVRDAGLNIEAATGHGAYRSLWWWLFWCDELPGLDARHPVLDHLALAWQALLDAPKRDRAAGAEQRHSQEPAGHRTQAGLSRRSPHRRGHKRQTHRAGGDLPDSPANPHAPADRK